MPRNANKIPRIPETTSGEEVTSTTQQDCIVDSDGDVLLDCGGTPTYQIQVSSKVLSLASKVFAAMLGPNFQEGQPLQVETTDLKRKRPIEIKLLDDHWEAMLTLCRVLHYRSIKEFYSLELLKAYCNAL